MIMEVLYDMRDFVLIFIFTLLIISIIFMKLDNMGESYYNFYEDYEGTNLMKGLKQTWDLANNAESYRFKTNTGWFFFFIGKLFITVVMFNLVI